MTFEREDGLPPGRTRRASALLGLAAVLALSGAPSIALAQSDPPPSGGVEAPPSAPSPVPVAPPAAPPPDPSLALAEQRFTQGVGLFRARDFDAAVVEFLAANELRPGWRSSSNAAVCLMNLDRPDEALELFDSTLRAYGDAMPGPMKSGVQGFIARLRRSTGVVNVVDAEGGALITIDGRRRGEYPTPGPLYVRPGIRVVRVYKSGYEPFEKSLTIAPGEPIRVSASLSPLVRSGELRVTERKARPLDVVIDGFTVGKAPWSGPLSVGVHTVRLVGAGDLGALPQQVSIEQRATREIELTAEDLGASIRVAPTPADASVAVNDIFVGRGAFEGRLRPGAHSVTIVADGYIKETRQIELKPGARGALNVALKRDPSSSLWVKPAKIAIDITGGVPLAGTLGGDVGRACAWPCSRAVASGTFASLQAGYERGDGIGFGGMAGRASLRQTTEGRPAAIQAVGRLLAGPGALDDTIEVKGFFAGAYAALALSEPFSARLRLGAGAVFGSITDTRTGSFHGTSAAGLTYGVGPLVESSSKAWIFLNPEIRTGYRLNDDVEVSIGVSALLFVFPDPPRWDAAHAVNASADGYGTLPPDALVSSVVFSAMPVVGVRYDF